MQLPPERNGYPAPPAIIAAREASGAAIAQRRWRTVREPRRCTVGGVDALQVLPAGQVRARVLHLHGGGFRMGLPEMDAPFAEALADRCGAEVLLPRYRLAPEHPFPAGLNDAWAALRALPRDLPLFVIGASAGGSLAAGAALLAAREGAGLAGLVLLSAWLDLRVEARAYDEHAASDPLFSRAAAEAAAELYLQGGDAGHPLASPLLAPPSGLPPTLISVGSGEVLADDSIGFHQHLQAAGVPCTLSAIVGMDHVAITRGLDQPGAQATFDAVAGFIAGSC
ncbi:MAG: alpha/beta hydrolase fold domain-containing protein [Sphingomonadales bacterium]|nr:alpha/beta hydrolase fold domain-containing protein [Sphingomonadales bacterium]